ncbi:non-ribosomal peptide synthetase [Bradyrhizobium prioriisuperbiae]|uniref:non-ribosomal peptide synthetase n=1 Tax=Bradyrhizobium prioriisuperbiae TaxID=2854389 RepID=UPI0028ECDD34|nr:non-ribosomal peptide synthetase [Bradyrhizobium prioritasuperba]
MIGQPQASLRSLTHPQKRIWLVEQLYPGTPIHNLAGSVTYAISLDFERLRLAFNQLSDVYATTRIRLVRSDAGEPKQYVADCAALAINIVDFSAIENSRLAFERWRDIEARRPFELIESPLMRVSFFRISEDVCGYLVNCHHLICDGWSMQLVASFVTAAYNGSGDQIEKGPSYFEFAGKELSYLQSPQCQEGKIFWLRELKGFQLCPVDRAGILGVQRKVSIAPERARALRQAARDLKVSLGSLLTAKLFLYVAEFQKATDIVIGMPVLNRVGVQKRSFGMFTSTMPVRIQFKAGESIAALYQRVQGTVAKCYRHQRFPFDLLVRELSDSRAGGQLFQACINVYNTDLTQAARIGDHGPSVEECYVGCQLFPLYVVVKEWSAAGAIELDINYKRAHYSDADVDHLVSILASGLSQGEGEDAADSCVSEQLVRRTWPEVPVSIDVELQPNPQVGKFPSDGRRRPREPCVRGERRPLPNILEIAWALYPTISVADRGVSVLSALGILLSRACAADEVLLGIRGIDKDESRDGLLKIIVKQDASIRSVVDQVRAQIVQGVSHLCPVGFDGVIVDLGYEATQRPDQVNASVTVEIGQQFAQLDFDASQYDQAEATRICARVAHVLRMVAESPAAVIAEVEVVCESEKQLLLDAFNSTDAAYPEDQTIVQLFDAAVARNPDRPAIYSNTATLSYSELHRRANGFARLLRDRGIRRGAIVPIMLERSAELLIGILGILKAGAAYLPIDPSYPVARIQFILADCSAACLVSRVGSTADLVGFDLVEVGLDEETVGPVDEMAGARDLAYVCYTSGSTGQPKGAMIEHRSLVNRLHWMQRKYPLTHKDVLLQKTSISFDVSVWELLWWALAGASLCLAKQGDERNPEELVKRIDEFHVTVIHFVPSMLQAFLNHLESWADLHPLRSLRRVFASGEALGPDQVGAFNRLFGGSVSLTNLYGPTEATIDVTYHDCSGTGPCDRVPIGRPIDNTYLRVLSPGCKLQPIHAPGELYIGGIGVARGYLHRDELTAQRFIIDPYSPTERLYRTGDVARWLPNGEVEYLGRNDDQVKVRGYRIEIGEIESTLRNHPAVKDAVVAVRKSNLGTDSLHGFVVLKSECSEGAFQEFLTASLPSFMVPTSISQIKSIPVGPSGKADRVALLGLSPTSIGEEPSTPLEGLLVQVWRDVLEAPEIGVSDNFFASGGDSIKVLSVVSKVKLYGKAVSAEDVYRNPTVRELASVVREATTNSIQSNESPFALLRAEDRARVPGWAEDAYPLSWLQHGLIFQSHLIRESPLYHDVFSYQIKGVFDRGAFEVAVSKLCQANTIIRTSYRLSGVSEPIQIVHPNIPLPLTIRDLRGLAAVQQGEIIEADIRSIRDKNFDWENTGLVGFHIHVLNESEYTYTIDFHDSALDGWSVNLIHRDLFKYYYAALDGRVDPPGRPASTFRQFIAIERSVSKDRQHKAYWDSVLAGSSCLRLPRWGNAKRAASTKVNVHHVSDDVGLSNDIKKVAARLGVPVKTVLLAAHVYVLSLLTSERDIVTGYEYGVRPELQDSANVIGLFLNTLPFRMEVKEGMTWQDIILSAYRTEVDFIAYRRYPMAKIKEDRKSRGPLFETVFNFTHFHILTELQNLPGFKMMDVMVRAETEFPFRFECSIHPFTNVILLWIHFHADVFEKTQIERIGQYYVRCLEEIVHNPALLPDAGKVIGAVECQEQLSGFNREKQSIPRECFHTLFERRAASHPDRIAIVCGRNEWTYSELDQAANRIAGAIYARTRGEAIVVGVSMKRSAMWVASVIACFKTRCAYLPIDDSYPLQRREEMLSKSGATVIVAISEEEGSEFIRTVVGRGGILVIFAEHQIGAGTIHAPVVDVSHDDLAYLMFTSGSTGSPKGAMVRHGGMLNHLFAKVSCLGMSEGDVIGQNASQSFDVSLWQMLAGLLVGARVVIVEQDELLDIRRFIARLRTTEVSVLEVVPSYLAVLLDHCESGQVEFDSLRWLLVTGEHVRARVLERWFGKFPRIPIVNAYGPTEASDDICHHVMISPPPGERVPVGRPLPNLNVYVLHQLRREIVPIGTVGEVCVSGIGVGAGYVNDPARTAAVFVEDPFKPGQPMYKTGDLGRWNPDGTLELVGRVDEQVKVRGNRVELGDVEANLLRCPGVVGAAAVHDEVRQSLAAFVVAQWQVRPREVRRQLSFNLPEHMVPSRIIQLDELPLSENGKIAKQKLSDLLQGLEDEIVPISPPTTALELELSTVWSELLEVDAKRINRNSNFFELGGNSLKAMELVMRLQDRFSINDVFKYPELDELARRIEYNFGEDEERLLIEFYASSAERVAIIGFTYAGGHAANFKPLFDAISAQRTDLSCYAVEVPRKVPIVEDVTAVAQRCAREIQENIRVPVVLWGHCSGAALALEVARQLESYQVDVRLVILGGKLINTPVVSKIRRHLKQALSLLLPVSAETMSPKQIKRWMIYRSGFDGFDSLGETEAQIIIEAFRQDAVAAARFFDRASTYPSTTKVKSPILAVVTRDDPLTRSYRKRHENWRMFSDRVGLVVLKNGGHYFIKTRPKEAADIVVRALRRLGTDPTDRELTSVAVELSAVV